MEGLAIARLASEQAQLASQKAEAVEARLIALEQAMDARLIPLEAKLMPREQISEEQAERIADLLKQAAIALSQKSGVGAFSAPCTGNCIGCAASPPTSS